MAALGTVLRWFSLLACGFVIVGFVIFAFDEAGKGSQEQIAKLEESTPAPEPGDEESRELEQGGVREFVDDINDVLLDPFASWFEADDIWVERTVPALLAIFVYGLLLQMLANGLGARERS
jgi:hypothetical protein